MLLLENFSITGAAATTAAGEPPFTLTSRFNIAPGKLSVNGVKVQCSAIATAPGSCSVGSGEDGHLPARRTGGLYKCRRQGWFCRGLSVPCFSGRRGHSPFEFELLPTRPIFWQLSSTV